MALSQEILDESELVKAKIANTDSLDDDYKRQLLKIINISTTATNGISPEEKIQQMTEALFFMAVSQVSFVTTIEDAVTKSIEKANLKQCDKCAAMKHAIKIEESEKQKKLIDEWKAANGIKTVDPTLMSWQDIAKKVITQPAAWVFLTVLSLSPYTIDIIKTITGFFNK